jgi:MinD-like ATPase involved in chromosome partitioning or flagellar assembly
MRIRLAIYDSNIEFMTRLSQIFQQKYADKIDLSMFTNEDALYENLKEAHADAVLFDQSAKIRSELIPEGITIGYFSHIPEVEEVEGYPAICKYQKAETIYKMILGLCAEGSSEVKLKKSEGDARIVLFTSVQGGSGTSTAAAAYALRCAKEKKRVFYLNLERFGDSLLYFSGEGRLSFSDVIYALKSRKGNLVMKIESAAKRDPSGVDFFHSCRNAYDMFELTDEEIRSLIQGLMQTGGYEEIVIDLSGELTGRMVMLMEDYAEKIVYVADINETGKGKFERFCEAARVLEQRQGCDILSKTCLIYNRCGTNAHIPDGSTAVPAVGGISRFQGIKSRELAGEIAGIPLMGVI